MDSELDIFRYKQRFFTFILLFSYAYLHIQLTGVFIKVTLPQCLNFTTPLPFAQRLLVPAMAHVLSLFLHLKAAQLFFLLEWFFITLFYYALKRLLKIEFTPRQAQLLTWLFLLLLPLVSVINYRFTSSGQGIAALYYPWDTSTLFFITVGFTLCLEKKWIYLAAWIALATFNRESSFLLVLLIPTLHWQERRTIIKPFIICLVAFIIARLGVIALVYHLPGTFMEKYYGSTSLTLIEMNLYWLLGAKNILFFIFCMAGLPVAWFVFYDYIPIRYRPLRYLTLFYFLGLLVVGIYRESRLFGEIIVLLYLPVCIALRQWLNNQPLESLNLNQSNTLLSYINRYAIITILFGIVIFRYLLIELVTWLINIKF